ncbi:Uncharacterized membrane protein YhaH, DUF805 family [Fodinibius salinus]|uniref:Uncharacterized membrane protein YhaH, DUF805 family n=1 Tax=Fodinibius salinus TaxID=860790 RepID=A0A5D3YP09_9BACT|nr:DUF805 domain-containing protein [Fodinibius salinus]TYP95432.1 Uncharacterized membrane protein YhaH, DUF805 family [Fodinibius salinus]
MKCENCGENIPLWQTEYNLDGITVCFDCYSNNYEDIKYRAKQKGKTKKKKVVTTNSENETNSYSDDDFFSTNGRIRRSTYFFRTLFLAIPFTIISLIPQSSQEPGPAILFILVAIGFGILQIIQAIKRLHDIDLGGEYILLSFIPIVNLIFGLYILFKEGTSGPNQYGEDPKKNERTSENKLNSSASNLKETISNKMQSSTNENTQNHGLDDLEKLADLKDKGIITEEEFVAKKKQILGL